MSIQLPAESESLIQRIRDRFPQVYFSVTVGPTNDSLMLANLIVPRGERQKGVGTAVMEAVTAFADRHGLWLGLVPAQRNSDRGTTSRARLVRFYRRFGFRASKGESRDFGFQHEMVRPPKADGSITNDLSWEDGILLSADLVDALNRPEVALWHGTCYPPDAGVKPSHHHGAGAESFGGLYVSANRYTAEKYAHHCFDPHFDRHPRLYRITLGATTRLALDEDVLGWVGTVVHQQDPSVESFLLHAMNAYQAGLGDRIVAALEQAYSMPLTAARLRLRTLTTEYALPALRAALQTPAASSGEQWVPNLRILRGATLQETPLRYDLAPRVTTVTGPRPPFRFGSPVEFGCALAAFLHRPDVFAIIEESLHCGWLDGGCLIAARALNRWSNEGLTPISLWDGGRRIVTHVAVQWNGWVFDAYGAHPLPNWATTWERLEGVWLPKAIPFDVAEADTIPDDSRLESALIGALHREFGPWPVFPH